MRFGPPPRMMTFLRSLGRGLVGERAGERHLVGRIEIRGRRGELGGAGVDPLEDRMDAELARGAPRPRPRSCRRECASRASEKPCAFSRRSGPARRGQAEPPHFGFRSPRSPATWRRNHGSMWQTAVISSTVSPSRSACAQSEQPVRRRPAERGADGVLVVALAEAGDRRPRRGR